ncbi:MAG: hypothetical protein JJU29_24015 [Verrucomicrobia bacterium]|nr:hypothetical protein [Verrucomicrobiota bacterium]
MENVEVGNKAMVSALLLYYHLLIEGGITHDQTVYIDPEDFDGFSFLAVKVQENLDIDESFIREAAVIRLLCDLNDMIEEFENEFWLQPISKQIITAFDAVTLFAIPETFSLFENISKHDHMDYQEYKRCLDLIYKKYVVERFRNLTKENSNNFRHRTSRCG